MVEPPDGLGNRDLVEVRDDEAVSDDPDPDALQREAADGLRGTLDRRHRLEQCTLGHGKAVEAAIVRLADSPLLQLPIGVFG